MIALVGLGYVGLPLAVAFGRQKPVIGFDISPKRIKELREGFDRTNEVTKADLQSAQITLTTDPTSLEQSDFIIVTVPTPVDQVNRPDLGPVYAATKTVGQHLQKGAIVVYESTVYPGCTEEDCVPILEQESGLRCGSDFKVGYSPERINPGDKEHTVDKIVKVVSGMDQESTGIIASVYGSIIKAGIHVAPTIKVAEAAKVIENTQRDLNIALMNELSLIFAKMGIDTYDVLEAAGTKWNFLKFHPGLVGGHCIGVDPYYLTYKAQQLGYHPQVILAGRTINDSMATYVAGMTLQALQKYNADPRRCNVLILGLTFKENVPDIRNSKVKDIIRGLQQHGVKVSVYDPYVTKEDAEKEFHAPFVTLDTAAHYHAIILAVIHREFLALSPQTVLKLLSDPNIFVDLRGVMKQKQEFEKFEKVHYYSL